MNEYSIWPFGVAMTLLLLIAATPLFRAADVPPNPSGPRISTLDGLRGFLASGVFFCHAAVYHQYLLDGRWELPPSRFYTLIGQVCVAVFFMITGYLFWSRVLVDQERSSWFRFYIGRVFRIGPLYLFAVGAALLIVFALQGPHLHVPAPKLFKELMQWFSLGFFDLGDFNGYHDAGILLAGVTWTLKFEWLFYLSLPFVALVAGRTKWHLPFVIGALVLCLVYVGLFVGPSVVAPAPVCIALFLAGMTCGSLAHEGMAANIPDSVASVIVGILICGVFLLFDSSNSIGATILLGAAFYLIANGCSIFGLLASRPARRLGDISYGIYLLQGPVLALLFFMNVAKAIALRSSLGHWSMMFLCATLLVIIATITHVFVERPGIELGNRFKTIFRKNETAAAAE